MQLESRVLLEDIRRASDLIVTFTADRSQDDYAHDVMRNGFALLKEKGSIRYYGKDDWPRLVRVDYHGSKEVPTGTCHAALKAAGIAKP